MAASNISLASLTVSLGMNSAAFRSGLRDAQRDYSSFHKSIAKGVSATVSSLKGLGTGFAAGAASVAAGSYVIKRSLDSIDDVRRLADNGGLAVDQFSAYGYAADRAGLSGDKFADVIKDLNVKIQDAADAGSGPLADFFDQIGDSAKAWAELKPAEQFRLFTKELESMTDNRARFWLDELNDSAAELFGTLRTGEFDRLTREASELGYALDAGAVQQSRQAKLAMDGLTTTLSTLWTQIVVNLSPAINSVAGGLDGMIKDAARAKGGFAGLGKTMALSIIDATAAVSTATTGMINTLISDISEVGQALGQDWFVNPQSRSIELAIQDLQRYRSEIETTQGVWVEGGDVPGYFRLPQSALDEIAEVDERLSALRQKLTGHIDNAAFLEALEQIRSSVKSFSADNMVPDSEKTQEALDQEAMALGRAKAAWKQYYQSREQAARDAKKVEDDTLTWQRNALKELKDAQQGMGDLFTDQVSRFTEGVGSAFETAVFESKNLGDSVSSIFEGMGRAMVSFFGEWAAQRMAQWVLEKTIGAADAGGYVASVGARGAAETQLGSLNAASSIAAIPIIGPALAPAAAAAFAGFGASITAAATGAAAGALAGMAHNGIDRVPREGTWLLDRGERVLTSPQADKLDRALAGGGMGGMQVSMTINGAMDPEAVGRAVDRTLSKRNKRRDTKVAQATMRGKANQGLR